MQPRGGAMQRPEPHDPAASDMGTSAWWPHHPVPRALPILCTSCKPLSVHRLLQAPSHCKMALALCHPRPHRWLPICCVAARIPLPCQGPCIPVEGGRSTNVHVCWVPHPENRPQIIRVMDLLPSRRARPPLSQAGCICAPPHLSHLALQNVKLLSRYETPHQRRIERIVALLAAEVAQLPRLPEHRRNIQWKVYIGDKPMVNAIAAPGGHIVVFTGACSRHTHAPTDVASRGPCANVVPYRTRCTCTLEPSNTWPHLKHWLSIYLTYLTMSEDRDEYLHLVCWDTTVPPVLMQ
jgi:hypothetical protein